MKILWMTWKDRSHPRSGGAEVVNEEIAKRLARDGHEVVFLVAGFDGAAGQETRDGFKIIRLGNHFTIYWEAYKYYKKNLVGWADVVVEEINTVPFFTSLYTKERRILFVHQLCREIWFYQIFFPLNIIGYLIEPFYLWFLRKNKVITVSESTKKDLMRFGFDAEKIRIISEGIEMDLVQDIGSVQKYDFPTLLSLGSIREMKRTAHQVRAFEIAKKGIPALRMKIAGDASSEYGKKVLEMIAKSQYKDDIEYLGKVSLEQKMELMQKSHVISVTSVKEGWGLIVTEANSQGTAAAAYDADGLRDSVKDGETGILAKKNTPEGLADVIRELLLDKGKYEEMRMAGWKWSRSITFDKSYSDFLRCIENL